MQKRANATRAQIVRGAAEVFEREGFVAATLTKIVGNAGVTKGALYFHFRTKEELAYAVFEEPWLWLAEPEEGTENPFRAVVDLCARFVNALDKDPVMRAAIRLALERTVPVRESGRPNPYDAWCGAVGVLLSQAESKGALVVAARVATDLVTAAVTGVLISERSRAGRDRRLAELWDVLAASLLASEEVA